MTDAELLGCFDLETDAEGNPKFDLDDGSTLPEPREMFRRHLRYNCISDPDTVEKLWREKTKGAEK
jgi:hypothetical protein